MGQIGVWIRLILTIILILAIVGMFVFRIVHKVGILAKRFQPTFDDFMEVHREKRKEKKKKSEEEIEDKDTTDDTPKKTITNDDIEKQEEEIEIENNKEIWQTIENNEEKLRLQLENIMFEANYLKDHEKFNEYEKKLVEGLALIPNNLELTKMLADYYFITGIYKKALPLLKKIFERDERAHKSVRQMGEIHYLNGDLSTSEYLVDKAIKLRPENPKYLLSMVEIYYHTDRVGDAISLMEKVVQLRPANTNYLFTMAKFYEEIDEIDNAKKHYLEVLKFDPLHEKAKKKMKNLNG